MLHYGYQINEPMESYIDPEKIQGGVRRLLLLLKEEKWKQDVIEKTIKEHKETIKILSNLSNKLNHKIIVPLSRVAFFEGEIKYTNNIFQNLGGSTYCERTSKNAEEHLKKKLVFYEEKHKIVAESINKIKKEIELALEIKEGAKWENNEDASEGVFLRPDGFLEIREKYESDEESKEITGNEKKQEIEKNSKKKQDIAIKEKVEETSSFDEYSDEKINIKREVNEARKESDNKNKWEEQKNVLNEKNKTFYSKAINKDAEGFIDIKENYVDSDSNSNRSDIDEEN